MLILGGANSYPFLAVVDRVLAGLLPHSQTITFPNAGHQRWLQEPKECRRDVEKFLEKTGIR